jgi:hypothetical protein
VSISSYSQANKSHLNATNDSLRWNGAVRERDVKFHEELIRGWGRSVDLIGFLRSRLCQIGQMFLIASDAHYSPAQSKTKSIARPSLFQQAR